MRGGDTFACGGIGRRQSGSKHLITIYLSTVLSILDGQSVFSW